MKDFFDNIIASIGINDVLDILIVSFIVYKILGFIRETRAQQLVKGLLVLVVAFFLSDILNLYAPVSYTHLDVYKRQGQECRHQGWRQ